jgi:glucose-6-phosphate 1-epimerase
MIELPSYVHTNAGQGGLPRVVVTGPQGSAEIYLHGAHLTAWHPATAAEPVLWLSRESLFDANKPIRGGVPICFPWFGAHASDAKAPAHGFARLREWTLTDAREDEDGRVTLTLELHAAPASATSASATAISAATPSASPVSGTSAWPFAFRATYRVTIGTTLTMSLEVHNPGSEPFTFEEALHTYFAVSDIRNVTVTGLERTTYLDKPTNFNRVEQGDDPIRFTGETDRIYLRAIPTCTIHDPGKQRTITITQSNADTTVVWNPWIAKAKAMADFGDEEWLEMLCVETCNVNDRARTLAAGATHTMTATIAVAPLAQSSAIQR